MEDAVDIDGGDGPSHIEGDAPPDGASSWLSRSSDAGGEGATASTISLGAPLGGLPDQGAA